MTDDTQSQTTVSLRLDRSALFRLTWLCDAEVDRLVKFADRHKDHAECEDDVADALNNLTYWKGVGTLLRKARDAR